MNGGIAEPVVDTPPHTHPPPQPNGIIYGDNDVYSTVPNGPTIANGHTLETPTQTQNAVRQPPAGSLEQPNGFPTNGEVEATRLEAAPSDSHALAETGVQDGDPVGLAQASHEEPEVKDLGWAHDDIKPAPLVGGLPNDDLWTLIRRFDKV
jgi:hypothetical protein